MLGNDGVLGVNGRGGGCCRGKRREEQKMGCERGGVAGARWGLMWRATAHHGLAGQAGGDARRHTAMKL